MLLNTEPVKLLHQAVRSHSRPPKKTINIVYQLKRALHHNIALPSHRSGVAQDICMHSCRRPSALQWLTWTAHR